MTPDRQWIDFKFALTNSGSQTLQINESSSSCSDANSGHEADVECPLPRNHYGIAGDDYACEPDGPIGQGQTACSGIVLQAGNDRSTPMNVKACLSHVTGRTERDRTATVKVSPAGPPA